MGRTAAVRVIDHLRDVFPDTRWSYDAKRGTWDGDDGSQVRATFSVYDTECDEAVLYRYPAPGAGVPENIGEIDLIKQCRSRRRRVASR